MWGLGDNFVDGFVDKKKLHEFLDCAPNHSLHDHYVTRKRLVDSTK